MLRALLKTGTSTIYNCLEHIPECEWTEEIVLELIGKTSLEKQYVALIVSIPERCKTYKVWLQLSVVCMGLLKRVPSKIATQSFYEDVVREKPMALKKVPLWYRTAKLCEIALDKTIQRAATGSVLRYVPHDIQTEEMILVSIDVHGGHDLASAAFQTRAICMRAVETEPKSISLVVEQTPEICEAAIQSTTIAMEDYDEIRDVISSIRDHTQEVCFSVLKVWPLALNHLRNHSREVCLEAIRLAQPVDAAVLLTYAREQHLEVCLAAYRNERLSCYVIRDVAMRRRVERLILANTLLMPLRAINLSTLLLIEVCEAATPALFPAPTCRKRSALTPPAMWQLAKLIRDANCHSLTTH
ncbi:MAG: hypothetical protein WC052_04395 [Patescibacteria group bacterium]